jgi:hypothetical protein
MLRENYHAEINDGQPRLRRSKWTELWAGK